jgi:SAM-dependent methyltransferase
MTEGFRCPLCGSGRAQPFLTLTDRIARTTDDEFTLVRCRGCGLLRLHPPPSEEMFERAYPDEYAPFNRPGLSGRAKRLLEAKGVRDLWDYLRPPRSILDVGCAGGELLDRIRRTGNSDVHGIEPDPFAASLARKRGIAVHEGYLEDAKLPDRSISTVLLDHVLEHVDDPAAFMAEVRRVLIGGGAVVIWLPNAASNAARRLGRYWMGYDAPRHLTTFNLRTLSRLLGQEGFRVAHVHHERSGVEWAWGLRLWLRERHPLTELLLARLHTPLILLATPLAAWAARHGRSGRIRVVAIRRPDRDVG